MKERSSEAQQGIRAILVIAGLDGAKIARQLGVSRAWVNRVIQGQRNRKVEKGMMAAVAGKIFPPCKDKRRGPKKSAGHEAQGGKG